MSQALSPHFSKDDLTRTDRAALQDRNRNTTHEQDMNLIACAGLLETCWVIIGEELEAHSGYRCPELNIAVGGSKASEHLLAQAVDFSPKGTDTAESIEAAFHKLLAAAASGKLKFGQLIVESQDAGREGLKFWIHISLGFPYRAKARCGEVLRMKDGKYTIVAKFA